MSEYKHSIADLQRCEREMLSAPWDVGDDAADGEVVDREIGKLIAKLGRAPIAANTAGIAVLRNAAPVLLEIAAAALAAQEARCDCESLHGCEDDCAALVAHRAYRAALAKVRQ